MKSKSVLIAAIAVAFLAVSCTPTTTPASTTTSEVAVSTTSTSSVVATATAGDFTFFNGPATEDSAVFDAKDFTKATISLKCTDGRFLKIYASPDGVNWLFQYNYGPDECKQGRTVTFELSGRYIKGNVAGTDSYVQMFGRFSS